MQLNSFGIQFTFSSTLNSIAFVLCSQSITPLWTMRRVRVAAALKKKLHLSNGKKGRQQYPICFWLYIFKESKTFLRINFIPCIVSAYTRSTKHTHNKDTERVNGFFLYYILEFTQMVHTKLFFFSYVCWGYFNCCRVRVK